VTFFRVGPNWRSTYATIAAGGLSYFAAMQMMIAHGVWLQEQFGLSPYELWGCLKRRCMTLLREAEPSVKLLAGIVASCAVFRRLEEGDSLEVLSACRAAVERPGPVLKVALANGHLHMAVKQVNTHASYDAMIAVVVTRTCALLHQALYSLDAQGSHGACRELEAMLNLLPAQTDPQKVTPSPAQRLVALRLDMGLLALLV
jgi:hypothetical protein